MTNYVAPLADMRFVLTELAGLDEVGALPGCEEVTPDLVEAILEEAGRFAGGVLAPLNQPGDREGSRFEAGAVRTPAGFADAYRQFCENGWNGLPCPSEYGGQNLPSLVAMAVEEMWDSANMAFGLCPFLTHGAIEALVHHASPELRERFVPRMVAGVWTGTMNLTEPQAGSDLAAVRTRAVPEGDRYRVYGNKIFITWGEHDVAENIVHLVLARLPDAPEGVKGISLFVVPKFLVNADGTLGARNDAWCVSLEHKLGIHASPTAVMAYGDKEGAIGYLVGEPHRGLEYMFTMMNHSRLSVGLEGVAIAERAYQQAVAYARERVQSREIGVRDGGAVPIIRHPDVRRMLLSMKSQVEAMRALAYFTAGAIDKARRHPNPDERARNQALVDLLTPVVKGWSTEQAVEICSTGIQIHGGMGFIEETGAAQFLRDSRIATIYEGTTGIQANDLTGRKMHREKGSTILALIEEMTRAVAPAKASANADVAATGAALQEAIAALRTATGWMLETYGREVQVAAAGAVPFLKLFGTVAGGWLMTRAATIAEARLSELQGDEQFYRAKIASARFYAGHSLALTSALARVVTEGSRAVLVDEAYL